MYASKQPSQSRIPVTGPKTNDNQHATGSFKVPPAIIDNSQAPPEIQKYSSEKVDIIRAKLAAKLAANSNTQAEAAPQREVPELGLVQRMIQNSSPRAKSLTIPQGEVPELGLAQRMIQNSSPRARGSLIQTKLTVGEPGDKYEQEADSMASKVMSMPDSALQRQTPSGKQIQTSELGLAQRMLQNSIPRANYQVQKLTPLGESIQKKVQAQLIQRASNRSFQPGGNIESQLNSSQGGGNPLSEQVRAYMEPRFGTDFSQVRVHTGESAVQMNQELGAQAFTHGSNIYYGAGKAPGVNELTAHELTHVVQQTGADQTKPTVDEQQDIETQIEITDINSTEIGIQRACSECEAEQKWEPEAKNTSTIQNKQENFHINFPTSFNKILFKPLRLNEQNYTLQPKRIEYQNLEYLFNKNSSHSSITKNINTSIVANERVDATTNKPLIQRQIKNLKPQSNSIRKSGVAFYENGLELYNQPAQGHVKRKLPIGTKLFIHKELSGGWYYIVLSSGEYGYVESAKVNTRLPEPRARLHKIKPGESAQTIANKYYKKFVQYGRDLRYYVNVLELVNRQGGGLSRPPNGSWQDTKALAGVYIWIPSAEFANSFVGKVSTGSLMRDALTSARNYAKAAEQKIFDYQIAIQLSAKYIPHKVAQRVKASLKDALQGLAVGLVLSAGILTVTTAIGAAIGSLAGGVGAAPGAAVGFKVGMSLLSWMGLAFLVQYLANRIGAIKSAFSQFLATVWNANGNAKKIDLGAQKFADAIAQLLSLILEGIVAYAIAKTQARTLAALKNSWFGKKIGLPKLASWLNNQLKDRPRSTNSPNSGLENRGYRPQPDERSMTRQQWLAQESTRRRTLGNAGSQQYNPRNNPRNNPRKLQTPKKKLETRTRIRDIAEKNDVIPGVVRSRINLANGRTSFTPLNKNGNPVSAGFKHVQDGHFGGTNKQSQFTITVEQLKILLQRRDVVASPVSVIGKGKQTQFVRIVDTKMIIGTVRVSHGGGTTTYIKIITDCAGNLITAYPIPKP